MPIAQYLMPDGRTAQFQVPDGTTSDQAQQLIGQIDFSKLQAPQSEPGFSDRVSNDLSSRGDIIKQQALAGLTGQQGLLESGFNIAGKGIAGGLADIAGEGINSATPDFVKRGLASGAQSIANVIDSTRPGQALGDSLNAGADAYNNFAKNNPRVSNVLDSAADIANVAPLAEAAKPVVGMVGRVSNTLGEGSGVSVNAALGGIPSKVSQMTASVPSSSDIRALASQSFQRADQLGGILKPEITNSWVDAARSVLPQTEEGKAVLGETPTTKLVDNIQSLRDKPLTLQGAMEIDSALGEKAAAEIDTKTGKMSAEGNKILQIQHGLRDMIAAAGEGDVTGGKEGFEAAKHGRDLWAASVRMNDVERIVSRAQMTDNPQTAIKTGFRNLASNPARLRGYTPTEIDAIKEAAKTGLVTGALKFGGSRLISSVAGATGGAAGGGFLGAGLGAAAGGAIGTPLRAAANALQRAKANNVLRAIADRPAVQAALNPVAKEAVEAAPQEMKLLPAPEAEMLTDSAGNTVPQIPSEATAAQRQAYEQLGLTPDILKVLDVNARNALLQRYGQSDLGLAVANNRNLTFRDIMNMPPAQARKLLAKKPLN